jgi:DNA-binding Xre family transcriptional regulator
MLKTLQDGSLSRAINEIYKYFFQVFDKGSRVLFQTIDGVCIVLRC